MLLTGLLVRTHTCQRSPPVRDSRKSGKAVRGVDARVHGHSIICEETGIGWQGQGFKFVFSSTEFLKYRAWSCTIGCSSLYIASERVWQASAVRADGAFGNWQLVQLDQEVEVSKRVLHYLIQMGSDEVDCVVRE